MTAIEVEFQLRLGAFGYITSAKIRMFVSNSMPFEKDYDGMPQEVWYLAIYFFYTLARVYLNPSTCWRNHDHNQNCKEILRTFQPALLTWMHLYSAFRNLQHNIPSSLMYLLMLVRDLTISSASV
jgi:hypothetical protein